MKYEYLNVNPRHRKEPDCVIRAISLATGADYYSVVDLLSENADIYACDELCVCCYSHLLTGQIGYAVHDGEGKTVRNVVDVNPDKILLLRLDGHLTCAKCGVLYDIWDCGNEIVDRYWIVE